MGDRNSHFRSSVVKSRSLGGSLFWREWWLPRKNVDVRIGPSRGVEGLGVSAIIDVLRT
jgi:hypothetical protein